ncbi:hypothetical protein Clacol_007006 [Clathrus columnatus]|uniref:Zn(2)-C6 fungal-type domain-containing protein n=1 Tax=Clathrus columnatus TaxID=1419009 RepID=A0AAV5AIK7_9AGAM|nr:hypothetical protein Clacol_007006 [Clathrus columnatus]
MENGEETTISKRTNTSPTGPSRPKRPKTSKACNACRKQKSRCERLAGDSDGCHRCSVIGITCVFDPEPLSTDTSRSRRPRPILPRSQNSKTPSDIASSSGIPPTSHNVSNGHDSPDDSRLHILANTTEMLSRTTSSATSPPSIANQPPPPIPVGSTPKTPLSPETLSNVESTLFPFPRDFTQENEFARLNSDWKRWIAPLTLVQNLVRRNAPSDSATALRNGLNGRSQDSTTLSALDEARLKKHFLQHYAPWLPVIRLGRNGSLDGISPFLLNVILATASRTLGDISHSCIQRLRELALNYVGQIFANPNSYPLMESLYALLILVLWPLDPADDVELLVHGAKRMASAGGRFNGLGLTNNTVNKDSSEDDNLDLTRLWYAICANETILTLGAGSVAPSPPSDIFIQTLGMVINPFPTGSASAVASAGGNASDIILILQTNLHGIITAAMGERGISAVSSISLNDGSKNKFPFDKVRDKEKIGQAIPRTREAWLSFIEIVYLYLTRLGEWEIEFSTIAAEALPSASPIYTVLEIEYHYLSPGEIKYALWSWSVTANKSAHAILKLFNQFSIPANVPQDRDEGSSNCRSRLAVFSSAPDRLYAMVVLAAMLILRHQVASSEYGPRRGPGESPPAGFTKQAELAIRRVVSRMTDAGQVRLCDLQHTSSCPHEKGRHPVEIRHDHSASRYVDILDALVRIWEEKQVLRTATMTAPRGCCSNLGTHLESRASSASGQYSATAMPSPYPHPNSTSLPQPPPPVQLDLNLLGTDLFSDAAAAFTWDSLGTIDWSTMGGMGGI